MSQGSPENPRSDVDTTPDKSVSKARSPTGIPRRQAFGQISSHKMANINNDGSRKAARTLDQCVSKGRSLTGIPVPRRQALGQVSSHKMANTNNDGSRKAVREDLVIDRLEGIYKLIARSMCNICI